MSPALRGMATALVMAVGIACRTPVAEPVLSEEAFRSGFKSGDAQPVPFRSLSRLQQQHLAALRPGMTRREVERYCSADGGLGADRRYILDQTTRRPTVAMVIIDFRPVGMDLATHRDPDRQAHWMREHPTAGWAPDDIVVAVSVPFRARPSCG